MDSLRVAAAPAPAGFGGIRGRVVFRGTPPAPKAMNVTLDGHVCGTEAKTSEALVVSPDGGVANAVVWVAGVDPGPMPAPAAPPKVIQKACVFSPHVVLVPQGGSIWLYNEDGVAHNFNARGKGANSMNFNQPPMGPAGEVANTVSFPDSGVVTFECSFHYWMTGCVYVAPHRLHVLTGPDGSFVLENVPAGQRRIKVWHEPVGDLKLVLPETEIPVPAGGEMGVELPISVETK